MVKETQFLCITTDLWTAAHSNLGLTYHGIDGDWQLRSFCLGIKELPIALTANNIGENIEEALDEWNIDKDINVAAFTDNARNMVNTNNGLCFSKLPLYGPYFMISHIKGFDIGPVKTALAHVSNIVSHFHHSSKATYSLKQK